ncbi:MAG: hypothetical protein H8E83_00070, partial [Planctomycetes bacterium]|nr:hypothetical protein [Planctomycetota bacterium]
PENLDSLQQHFEGTPCEVIGTFNETNMMTLGDASWNIDDLFQTWAKGMVI